MGRPLNKKYFANTNYQDFGTAGVGGESVASVAVTGTFSGKTPGTYDIPASVISAPQIAGGAKPTLTITLTATAGTVTVVTAGSGYTSAPTISGAALQALGGAGTGTVVCTATLTANGSARQNGILVETQFGSGGSEILTGDIIKQVSTRRYKVQTSAGTGVFKLVTTAALGANEMSITATDSAGGTYLVAKLTAHKAVLVPTANTPEGATSSAGSQFVSGTTVKWTFGTAVINNSVTINNQ